MCLSYTTSPFIPLSNTFRTYSIDELLHRVSATFRQSETQTQELCSSILETVEDEVKAYIYSNDDESLTFESAILQAALYSTEDVNLPKKILQAMILNRVDLARTEIDLFASANIEKKV